MLYCFVVLCCVGLCCIVLFCVQCSIDYSVLCYVIRVNCVVCLALLPVELGCACCVNFSALFERCCVVLHCTKRYAIL